VIRIAGRLPGPGRPRSPC